MRRYKTKLTNKKWTSKTRGGGFDSDLTDEQIAEANARHDAEMKSLGRGFYDQTVRILKRPAVVIFALGYLSLSLSSATSLDTTFNEGDFLRRIALIESSGNPSAIGDGGSARGLYQMHRAAWDDACRSLGVNWNFSQATNAQVATCVAREHLRRLAKLFVAKRQRQPSFSEAYAMWNLGFDGFRKRGYAIDKCPLVTRRAISKGEKL